MLVKFVYVETISVFVTRVIEETKNLNLSLLLLLKSDSTNFTDQCKLSKKSM